MRDSASPHPEDWLCAIEPLLGGVDLDELAFRTRALVRKRGVKSARSLLRLALARGPGGMSLRQTAAWAQATGVAELTDPSLNDRLHGAGDFLAEIVAAMLRNKSELGKKRWAARSIRLSDGSCVSKPGSKGVDWRLHCVYDLDVGGFSHIELTNGKGAEAIDRGRVEAGEIRLADRGYAHAKALRRFLDEAEPVGGDFVVRLRWNAFRLASLEAQPFDLCRFLQSLPEDQQTAKTTAQVLGAGKPMPIRIVVRRKPPEAVEAELTRMRQRASRMNRQIDPRSRLAAQFVMLATSLAAPDYPAGDVLALYRLRWQIEIAFKRLKSLLDIDNLPAVTEPGGRSWLYACLIFAIAVDRSAQEFLDSFPSRTR